MTFVDRNRIILSQEWKDNSAKLTASLCAKKAAERSATIAAGRKSTWAHEDLKNALRAVVGNKCWYSETPIVGADADVDHFRPKGRVRDVDVDNGFERNGEVDGYWWLAFEWENYRLSCQHANQRRTDIETAGGKSDFFPVDGVRAGYSNGSSSAKIVEKYLPLDPCSATDVALIRFSTEGKAISKPGASLEVERRVRVSTWLYHLDKKETSDARMEKIRLAERLVNDLERDYALLSEGNLASKGPVDSSVANLKEMMADSAPFRLAVHCLVATALRGTEIGDLVFGP